MSPGWKGIRNLLAVRLDAVGDVLMTTPALRAFRESLGCRVTLLTSAVAYWLVTRFGMFATIVEPRGGAVSQVTAVSVQSLPDVKTCTPVAVCA